MRLLNDEEWGRIYSKWLEYPGGTAGDLANAMIEAQHQLDLREFIEDIEYHGEGCSHVGNLAPWKTADWIILPMSFLNDLKQLVEE